MAEHSSIMPKAGGSKKTKLTLLTLPAEMRNAIYRYVLVLESPIVCDSPDLPTEPALLRTCRAIRLETRSIWYEENTFDFTIRNLDAQYMIKWLAKSRNH